MLFHFASLGQSRTYRFTSGIVLAIALSNCPPHNSADPVFKSPGCLGLGSPNRQQAGHNVSGAELRNGLAPESWHSVHVQAGPPDMYGNHLLHRFFEQRYAIFVPNPRVNAICHGSAVFQSDLACFGERYYRVRTQTGVDRLTTYLTLRIAGPAGGGPTAWGASGPGTSSATAPYAVHQCCGQFQRYPTRTTTVSIWFCRVDMLELTASVLGGKPPVYD